jgi:outer membrane protein assembly factor BamC
MLMSKALIIRILTCAMALVVISGCQSYKEKRKIEYKTTRTLPPLEVPPDLSTLPQDKKAVPVNPTTSTATYSEYVGDKSTQPAAAIGSAVLPEIPEIKIERDSHQRWLLVQAKPELLWSRIRDFVLSNGLLLAMENPQTGIFETEWAENRAQVGSKTQTVLAKWLGSLYSTGTRDKFRIRLERGVAPDTTEIYLSHRGMKEVVASGGGTDPVQTIWQPREPDPGLEAEMLRLLMVHLGTKPEQAATQLAVTSQVEERAKLSRNGRGVSLLSLEDSLDRAWRRVGLSLDRIGFTVEDRDRSKGIYYVRYIDPEKEQKKKGFFSKMFSGKDNSQDKNQYLIQLEASDPGTNVQVLDKDGSLEESKTGDRILSLLYEQLK